jgi:outer membrane lipoprotein carrier protein
MKYLTALLFASIATGATASGLDSLERFVRTVKSGHAEFTQVVTSPAKDGQTPRRKTSSGVFDFSRPSKFKFSYRKPFEQSIVADGKRIWIYDVDLNQVTSRKQSEALAASPASLIATASDIKTLEADFAFTTAPSAG